MVLGAAAVVVGVVRLALRRHFTLALTFYCLMAIPASILLFLILDYTLRHSRVATLVVLTLLLVLAVNSPSFCVGLGLAVLVMIVTKWP
jgi:hypothetical protein